MRSAFFPAILALLGVGTPASAGTFVMRNVAAVVVESNYGYMVIEVRGSAVYQGTKDPGDNNWQINTLLNHNRDGDSLSNWSAPDAAGNGLTGFSIFEGQVVSVNSQPRAAYANLYRLNCPQTFNYRGRGAVTVYHNGGLGVGGPEISTMDTFTSLVGCYTPQGGGGGGGGGGVDPCNNSTSTTGTLSSIESGELLATDSGGYPLKRQDIQGQTRFALEEWAVVEVTPGNGHVPSVKTLNASSDPYGQMAAAKVRASHVPMTDDTVLVVDGVTHPRNGRHIPIPEVNLRAAPLPAAMQGHDLVVRADFSETGELTDLQVVHSDAEVSEELLEALREGLQISYQDSGRHRAIAFVTFDVDGTVTIRSSQVVLPQCCCYSDEIGIWCI